jgi:transcriptional regulator with XRE-family HTH domain
MKLNEAIAAPGYEDLLFFEDINEEDRHNATMIMFKFLSGIEDVSKDKLSRKKLAELIGTSPSYITQLFRGDKLLNLLTIAKFERVLNIEFVITPRFISDKKTSSRFDPKDVAISQPPKSADFVEAIKAEGHKEYKIAMEDMILAPNTSKKSRKKVTT